LFFGLLAAPFCCGLPGAALASAFAFSGRAVWFGLVWFGLVWFWFGFGLVCGGV